MSKKVADKIFVNGQFYSTDLDCNMTCSEAVAVCEGKFIYVGEKETALTYKGINTEVIDLNGKMVLPGLSDAHMHPSMLVSNENSLDLYGVSAEDGKTGNDYLEQYLDKIRQYAKENKEKDIIKVGGIDAGLFLQGGGKYPSSRDLDKACSDRPVIVRSYCLHNLWINTKALELSGLDKHTPDIRGGVILRDEEGEPTGFFQEIDAIDMVISRIPGAEFTVDEYKNAILGFQNEYAAPLGLTMVFDALADRNAKNAYRELINEGRLKMRVRCPEYIRPETGEKQVEQLCHQEIEYLGDDYKANVAKFFIDGSQMNICLTEPYEKKKLKEMGLPDNYKGELVWHDDEIKELFLKLTEAGYQIHTHVMGDGAAKQVLDGFEYVKDVTGYNGNRNVMTHIMLIREEDKKRMGTLGVIAAMQPIWGCVESVYEFGYIPSFGKYRSERFYPLKTLLENGVKVAFGSDFPIGGMINPYQGLQTAITRTLPRGLAQSGEIFDRYKNYKMGPEEDPERECMSLEECIAALTIVGAWQHGLEKLTGSIENGKSADMVILSQNLENVDTSLMEFTEVEETIFKGETIYRNY